MTGNIRLLVLDIDGTIAGQSNQISLRVREAIRQVQQRGIEVAIATGRTCTNRPCGFTRPSAPTLPLMAYQGAYIKHPQSQTLHRHTPLPRQLALEILAFSGSPRSPARAVHSPIH